MRIFKITKEIEVVCKSEKTRSGFRHLATLFKDGQEVQDGKCVYYNRTWEKFEFQSVLYNVVEKAVKNKLLSEEEEKLCKEFIEGDQTDWSGFKATAMIAQLGEVFADTKKEKNDWKTRMLKAGLENKGLQIPDDWDELDEDEKERRLNGAIKIMGDKE